jgi:hypothetical protein
MGNIGLLPFISLGMLVGAEHKARLFVFTSYPFYTVWAELYVLLI